MTRRYRGLVYDSSRWQGFDLRAGDIVISTPPKCGTTWTQMICALLVFQEPELPRPLAELSPWLDMVTRPRTEVVADLEAQTHRRFIKTHTPLDGLPMSAEVTYVCVGRDPRDVALSMDNHMDNLDLDAFRMAREHTARVDGIPLEPLVLPPERPTDPNERFWRWVDNDTPPTESPSSLRRTVTHVGTFWDAAGDLDIVLLHYDDLQADLEGQMRALAERLGIDVPDGSWPQLVAAATFDAMRQRADVLVPGGRRNQWRDPDRFFHRGTSGQWRDLLDPADVARYAARVRALAPDDLVDWLHRGPIDAS